ncbi:MAG: thioredoxin family protein [Sphingobacteriales bacterium]|nr:MAG: thioredoxin family protein [Sphingobacteriales bacterium]
MMHGSAFCQEWLTDFDAAKKQAATSGKNILLVFSGPEWCKNCTKLDTLVWESTEFKAEAEKNWVLLRADFAQKKGMPEPVDVNDTKMILTEKYNRDGFFPFIVLLDKTGKKLGKVGYENFETVAEYIKLFKALGR